MKLAARLLLVLLLLLLVSLACNLPIASNIRVNPTLAPLRTKLPPEYRTPDVFGAGGTSPGGSAAGTPLPTNVPPVTGSSTYTYHVQSGDTLPALAGRFGVDAGKITSAQPIPPEGLLAPGHVLEIPVTLSNIPYTGALMPDQEIVYGPAAAGFDIAGYISSAGGYLASYSEKVGTEQLSGTEIVRRAAVESSINPRLLLGILDYTSGWVRGQPRNKDLRYPIGFYVNGYEGLSKELSLTIRQLKLGYYGWRAGTLTELTFIGNQKVRISPQLNAGTVAVQYLFTMLLDRPSWEKTLYGGSGFTSFYTAMMGDPWARAQKVGPVFPPGLEQPPLVLPFAAGENWDMTGGPHESWGVGDPRGAIDFAPVTGEKPCVVSSAWARAAAPGLVVRSERNAVVIDLDGDGSEATGWELFYYHIAKEGPIAAGTKVKVDDPLGHPSCEGARATGTHVHLARKYNGEWLPAGVPLPMVLSGWTAHAGAIPYEGSLTKGDQTVVARPDGEHDSLIVRTP